MQMGIESVRNWSRRAAGWLALALLAGALAGAVRLLAQSSDKGILQGMVRDEADKPIANAVVKIFHPERKITVTVFTQAGSYNAPDLYPGKVEVTASLAGNQPAGQGEAEIVAGKTSSLNLTLDEKSSSPILTPADWIPELPDDHDGVKELVINRCVNCHGPAEYMRLRLDALNWKKVIIDMGRIDATLIPNYASIPDSQAMALNDAENNRLVAYFVKHFGPNVSPGLPTPPAVSYRSARTNSNIILTQFDIPTPGAIPHNLNMDPDGNVWFVERFADKIGELDPKTGKFREWPIPADIARPHGIFPDGKGNVYWTESQGNHLGRLDVKTGKMTRYPLPHPASSPHTIYLGPDGRVWFTEILGGRIGSFDPKSETFKEYDIPTEKPRPYGIVIDSHYHIWFCEFTGNKIGRLDGKTEKFDEFPTPTANSGPRRLNLDRNQNVWFTEYNVNKIARLDHDTGKITEWNVPTPDSGPYDIVVDRRGMIWFDEFTANKVVHFDPATAQFTEYPLPGLDSQVRKMTMDQNGAIWLSEYKNSRMVRLVERR